MLDPRGRRSSGGWERLIARRVEQGMSQAALARHLGTQQFQISHWESLKEPPDWRYLVSLAEFMGMTKEELAVQIAQKFFA